MPLCGRLTSDGSACMMPNGHAGACEILFAKRKRGGKCGETTWNPTKVTLHHSSIRIGPEYQAELPEYIGPHEKKQRA